MYFNTKDNIAGRYTVTFPIKRGAYAETYRVRDAAGKRCFLKLIDPLLLKENQLGEDGTINEIEILRQLSHPALPRFVDAGPIEVDGRRMQYVVTDFISSETATDRMLRSRSLTVFETRKLVSGVLVALKYLHGLPEPVLHNEVSALNMLIDLSGDNSQSVRLIDFGSACKASEARNLPLDGLDWFYLAPERFSGEASVSTDLYSVGAVIYELIFGIQPWFADLSGISPDRRMAFILKAKATPLRFPVMDKFELDDDLLNVMRKAMAYNPADRFASADEFLAALSGQVKVTPPPVNSSNQQSAGAEAVTKNFGGGFADVAGMASLKDMLEKRVINILRNKEKALKYRLQIPNGILFYGPPGCGKSFLAEKFAEEAGYNFKLVKASDLASIYVHGSQEKIGQLFEEARKNSPTILCFDEFDALVPARGQNGMEHQSGEVNEFLTQLNNCGERGVFVIASTNRPDMIDPAVLRRGRIDKVIYIPVPDEDSRAAMFELHLQGRPYDSNIDFAALAAKTDSYVASDIAYVVNEAAGRAAFSDAKISQEILEEVIGECRPSLSPATLANYEKLREKMEGTTANRPRIGFE